MSDLLPPVLRVTLRRSDYPGDILQGVAAQISPLTGAALQGEIRSISFRVGLRRMNFFAIVAHEGPGHG